MDSLLAKITEWIKEALIGGITTNFTGMFDMVNQKVGEIAGQVGQTPESFNSGIFSMIRSLSETVVIPIAGMILTFILCYELITMIIDRNNMHDFETWIFFKWIFSATRSHTNTIPQEIKLCGRLVQVVLKMGGFRSFTEATTDTLMSGMMG